jgi:hypothetical protein
MTIAVSTGFVTFDRRIVTAVVKDAGINGMLILLLGFPTSWDFERSATSNA